MNVYSKNQTLVIVCMGLLAAVAVSAHGERIDEAQELLGEGEYQGGLSGGLSGLSGVSNVESVANIEARSPIEQASYSANNVLAQITGGLSNLIGAQREAPLSPVNLEGRSAAITSSDLLSGVALDAPAPSAVARGVAKEERKDLFSLKGIGEWAKILFNPIELVRAIGVHFKLDVNKVVDKLGRTAVFGVEAILSPVIAGTKIVEKIFVPDACRLKFMCRMGTYLVSIRESVLKFSPNFLESSTQIKAFSDGIVGRNCESAFPSCEPRLRPGYSELRTEQDVAYVSGARSGQSLLPKDSVVKAN